MNRLRHLFGWALFALTFWALAPASAQENGPPNSILCNKSATMAATPTSVTAVIAAVTGQRIYLCGWNITNTGATGTVAVTSGTQATNPCDTGTVTITPALSVTNTMSQVDHIIYAAVQSLPGQAMCVTPSVATIAAVLWYYQGP